jgi:hypothetical protein
MKKKSRIEMAREIVAYVKREMDQPRMTESVRNSFVAQAVSTREKPVISSARAAMRPF